MVEVVISYAVAATAATTTTTAAAAIGWTNEITLDRIHIAVPLQPGGMREGRNVALSTARRTTTFLRRH